MSERERYLLEIIQRIDSGELYCTCQSEGAHKPDCEWVAVARLIADSKERAS